MGMDFKPASQSRTAASPSNVTVPDPGPASLRAGEPGSPSGPVRPSCILVVEDVDINREIIHGLLRQWGLAFHDAADGLTAVACAATGLYNLILMDIQLPELDGLKATRRIRQLADPMCSSVPVLAITANAGPQDISRFLDAGMNDFIFKPIDANKLYRALARWLPDLSRQLREYNGSGPDSVVSTVAADSGGPQNLPASKLATSMTPVQDQLSPTCEDPAGRWLVFDPPSGLILVQDNISLYHDLLRIFLDQFEYLAERIELDCQLPDARALRQLLQAVQKSAAFLGSPLLAGQVADWLNRKDDSMTWPLSAESRIGLARLLITHRRLLLAIRAYLNRNLQRQGLSQVSQPGEVHELLLSLCRIMPYVQWHDPVQSRELLAEPLRKRWPPAIASQLDAISYFLAHYEYNKVIQIIDGLMASLVDTEDLCNPMKSS